MVALNPANIQQPGTIIVKFESFGSALFEMEAVGNIAPTQMFALASYLNVMAEQLIIDMKKAQESALHQHSPMIQVPQAKM